MKNFLSGIGKTATHGIVFGLFALLTVFGVAYALSYPSTPPSGQVAGGKFTSYFTKMFTTDCGNGQAVYGFGTDGAKKCRQVMTEYQWTITGYGSCSASCGMAGTMNATYKCKKYDGTYVADSSCPAPKPTSSSSCNGPACPAPAPAPVPVQTLGCGSANGVAVSSAPNVNLCVSGTSPSVPGMAGISWTWTCNGSNSSVNCSAPLAIGTKFSGGALYVGTYGGINYMITPSGCEDNSKPTCAGGSKLDPIKTWNNGSEPLNDSWKVVGATSDNDGVSNTNLLSSLSASKGILAPFKAAKYCQDMDYGGYGDWYLPAKNEINQIWGTGGGDINFPPVNYAAYWSSTEYNVGNVTQTSYYAWVQGYLDSTHPNGLNGGNKGVGQFVRCIRRF